MGTEMGLPMSLRTPCLSTGSSAVPVGCPIHRSSRTASTAESSFAKVSRIGEEAAMGHLRERPPTQRESSASGSKTRRTSSPIVLATVSRNRRLVRNHSVPPVRARLRAWSAASSRS